MRQVLDNEVDELDLVGVSAAGIRKLAERSATAPRSSHARAGITCEAANCLASLEGAQDEATYYCYDAGSTWRPTEVRLLDLLVRSGIAMTIHPGRALRSRGEPERWAWVG